MSIVNSEFTFLAVFHVLCICSEWTLTGVEIVLYGQITTANDRDIFYSLVFFNIQYVSALLLQFAFSRFFITLEAVLKIMSMDVFYSSHPIRKIGCANL